MTENITVSTFEVRRDDWSETRVVAESLDGRLDDNEVLLTVDRLALTANNISYAAAGDTLGYWRFFPAAEGWGRIPAMGWADVAGSAHPDVKTGERVWGFFPLSTHLKIVAGKTTAARFCDVSPHRAELAPVYAQFDRAAANPVYEAGREDQDSLLRGLFLTSWLADDFLGMNAAFGAEACLITSASSKTGIALGFCVQRRAGLTSVGVTSAGNVPFCESLGCYDKVVAYEELAGLDASRPVVLVDMAGSAELLGNLHRHYGDNMKYSCRIGATHHSEVGPVDDLPGARPEFFFAPAQIKTRSAELGGEAVMMRIGADYVEFRRFADSWLAVQRHYGPEALADVYRATLEGRADPATGQIVSMWPDPRDPETY